MDNDKYVNEVNRVETHNPRESLTEDTGKSYMANIKLYERWWSTRSKENIKRMKSSPRKIILDFRLMINTSNNEAFTVTKILQSFPFRSFVYIDTSVHVCVCRYKDIDELDIYIYFLAFKYGQVVSSEGGRNNYEQIRIMGISECQQ